MINKLMDYYNDAVLMSRSSFPQDEKNRHYKELLVKIRNDYGSEDAGAQV
ncbi:hypothetical protein [Paenibacillus darwinianus]|nr:hypothetical protein [Paenibacillus darwinianus]